MFNTDNTVEASLGCWRGHMDIYRRYILGNHTLILVPRGGSADNRSVRMVQDRIQSALVLEDDADWDVMIKAQMAEVARGSQYVQLEGEYPLHSPYGDNWCKKKPSKLPGRQRGMYPGAHRVDETQSIFEAQTLTHSLTWHLPVWINLTVFITGYIATGHCSVSANTDTNQKHWVMNDDPTVVPEKHRDMPFFVPNTGPKYLDGKNKRLLFGLNKFMCTGSYAVSLQGASKFLYDQEVELNAETVCSHHFSLILRTFPLALF